MPMKLAFLTALLMTGGCAAQSAESKAAAPPPAQVKSNWRTCGVANAVAQQFARALVTLGQLDHYVTAGKLTFRVCDEESLDCNETPQPFPASCETVLSASNGRKQTTLVWSPAGIPHERKTPYALVMVNETEHDVVFSWPMNYQFNGSPTLPDGEPSGILAGVTEVRGDAPTIRVVVARFDARETKGSVIQLGERSVELVSP